MKNKKALIFIILSGLSLLSFSQVTDTAKVAGHFSGAVTVTNKGISTIPNLTLGKPAAIFDMSIGRKLSFNPQFRFALEGKPWSFLFWWRYKLLDNERLQMNIGAHPAFSFKTITDTVNGTPKEIIRTTRYLAGELSPTFKLSKMISMGMYYLYSHGIEKDITQNTHLLAFRSGFSNIRLSKQFFLRVNPQIYYLKMDKYDGFYFNSTLALTKKNCPVSVTALINNPITTNIKTGNDLLWNVSLTYSFNKEYVEK